MYTPETLKALLLAILDGKHSDRYSEMAHNLLLAHADAWQKSDDEWRKAHDLMRDAWLTSKSRETELLAALQMIVDYGDTGTAGRPAYHDMRAIARSAIKERGIK